MRRSPNFEIIEVADEHLVVPVGAEASRFHGVVVLSEAAAYLLEHMDASKTEAELVLLLTDAFDVSQAEAEADVHRFLNEVTPLGLIDQ